MTELARAEGATQTTTSHGYGNLKNDADRGDARRFGGYGAHLRPVPRALDGETWLTDRLLSDTEIRERIARSHTEGQDMETGRECPCGAIFAPTGPRSKYCGPDCSARPSKAEQNRQVRERRKAKGNGATKRKAVQHPDPEPASAGDPSALLDAIVAAGQSSPGDVLRAAGFECEELETPGGLMVMVRRH